MTGNDKADINHSSLTVILSEFAYTITLHEMHSAWVWSIESGSNRQAKADESFLYK